MAENYNYFVNIREAHRLKVVFLTLLAHRSQPSLGSSHCYVKAHFIPYTLKHQPGIFRFIHCGDFFEKGQFWS